MRTTAPDLTDATDQLARAVAAAVDRLRMYGIAEATGAPRAIAAVTVSDLSLIHI